MYRIIRMYYNRDKRSRTIKTGLTLEQAQAHCSDPETSSRTAQSAKARAITRRHGAWFDTYEETYAVYSIQDAMAELVTLAITEGKTQRQWNRLNELAARLPQYVAEILADNKRLRALVGEK